MQRATAKPSARLRRGEILLPNAKEMILKQIIIKTIAFQKAEVSRLRARPKGFPIALWKPSGPSLWCYTFDAAQYYPNNSCPARVTGLCMV